MVSEQRVREASAAVTEGRVVPAPASVRVRCRVGLVAAFSWEVKPLLRRLPLVRKLDRSVYECSAAGEPFVLAVAGAGSQNAFDAARDLAERFAPESLATIGFAGALDGALKPGDIVVAEDVLEQVTGQRWECGAGLLAVPGGKRGLLLSTAEVIASAERKRQLARDSGAVAVDMESAGVARAAALAGLPFCAVKSITDTAEESLAIDFARCRREHEGLSLSAIVWEGLASFRGAGDLLRLALNARRAAGALAEALADGNGEIRGER